jgi:haloalkane dehalogenase
MHPTESESRCLHDWGSALGFNWAYRHPEKVRALVYMEAIVRPFASWNEWPDATRAFFQAQRTPAGEDLVLGKNLFIEYLLPLRNISPEVMEVYRWHYRTPGPSRQPMSDKTVCTELSTSPPVYATARLAPTLADRSVGRAVPTA